MVLVVFCLKRGYKVDRFKFKLIQEVKMKLLISALTKFIFGIVLVGALLFLPAWTLDYFGAWLFLGILFKLRLTSSK